MNVRTWHLIKLEADRIRTHPFGSDNRATIKVARRVLLEGNLIWEGALYEPRSKHLGVGVYQITFVRKEG